MSKRNKWLIFLAVWVSWILSGLWNIAQTTSLGAAQIGFVFGGSILGAIFAAIVVKFVPPDRVADKIP